MLKFGIFSSRTHFKDVDLSFVRVPENALVPRNAPWTLLSPAQFYAPRRFWEWIKFALKTFRSRRA